MSSWIKALPLFAGLLLISGTAGAAANPANPFAGRDSDLGRKASDAEVRAWDIDVRPDFHGLPEGAGTPLEGEEIWLEQCAACHGDEGAGDQSLGAPNLTDAIWLYGGEKAEVVASIAKMRHGVMPYWQGRLDEVTIKQLTLYVYSLGGGQ